MKLFQHCATISNFNSSRNLSGDADTSEKRRGKKTDDVVRERIKSESHLANVECVLRRPLIKCYIKFSFDFILLLFGPFSRANLKRKKTKRLIVKSKRSNCCC